MCHVGKDAPTEAPGQVILSLSTRGTGVIKLLKGLSECQRQEQNVENHRNYVHTLNASICNFVMETSSLLLGHILTGSV